MGLPFHCSKNGNEKSAIRIKTKIIKNKKIKLIISFIIYKLTSFKEDQKYIAPLIFTHYLTHK
jgi:hypothetical protein